MVEFHVGVTTLWEIESDEELAVSRTVYIGADNVTGNGAIVDPGEDSKVELRDVDFDISFFGWSGIVQSE
jgi:hypothetical protein